MIKERDEAALAAVSRRHTNRNAAKSNHPGPLQEQTLAAI